MLVWTFLKEFCSRMGKKITTVPRSTMELLQRQPWPGNVRQLRNVIEHGVIITTGDTLMVSLADERRPETVGLTLAEQEREIILKALRSQNGRIKGPDGATAKLGIHFSTLYGRMKRLGVTLSR